jgi:hypothetical protein
MLIPKIIEMVKAVELPGNGADKLAIIVNFVHTAFEELAPELLSVISGDKIKAFTVRVVGIIVGFLNKVGVFAKRT